MVQDIITFAAVVAAIVALFGYYNKVHDWIRHQEEQDKRMDKIEHDAAAVQKELALIVRGLSACLDGLNQLGANHTVPDAKKQLDEHINRQAHGQEV